MIICFISFLFPKVEHTKTERKVLSIVDHPFLLNLIFSFQTAEKLYILTDFCPGGELFFHLKSMRRFTEGMVRFYRFIFSRIYISSFSILK